MRFQSTGVVFLSSIVLSSAVLSGFPAFQNLAQAAGKKPAPSSDPGTCTPTSIGGSTTPHPVRKVVLKPVTANPFNLPNGARVDIAADLNLMLQSAVSSANAYSPTDPGPGVNGDDVCGTHLEIRAGVTSFVLNAFELGVSFGYAGSSEQSTVSSVKGTAKVTIGSIAMNFGVFQCTGGECSELSNSNASALTAGVDLNVELDFGAITTGPQLTANPQLANALRSIMDDGMKALAGADTMSGLYWSARVREYLPAQGLIVFDAGIQSRIQPNQSFTVYAQTAAQSACHVFQAVAHVHSTQVEAISTTALVDELLDPRGIQDGDVIRIHPVGNGN